MSEVANIYDNGPISPVAKIKENISVWLGTQYSHFNIDYIEPVPRSRPFLVDLVALAGIFVIPANGIIAQGVVPALQMNSNEIVHLRWEPLDDIEGGLWQLGGAARFNIRGGQARVSLFTSARDPYLATTTFWIYGATPSKDAQIGAFNPNPVPLPMARFVFWGYRYKITPLTSIPASTTYLPAQAWQGG
jgi:hypothetical protein